MNDLGQIDLSSRVDAELSAEEREELQRRFKSFTQAVKEAALMRESAAPPKPKKVVKWNPLALAKGAKA